MGAVLVSIVTVIYATVGVIKLLHGNPGFAMMWFGYAIANVGLMWAGGA